MKINLNAFKFVNNVIDFFKIAKKLSKMVSEQHLFFRNVELENNRPLKEYMVNAGDTLCLKVLSCENKLTLFYPK